MHGEKYNLYFVDTPCILIMFIKLCVTYSEIHSEITVYQRKENRLYVKPGPGTHVKPGPSSNFTGGAGNWIFDGGGILKYSNL